MPDDAAAEKTGSAEHGDGATVRPHPLIFCSRDSRITRAEADVRAMAVYLGKPCARQHRAEERTLDFRTSHTLTAFATSVSLHSYKGRMKPDRKRARLAGRHSHLALADTMTAPPPEPLHGTGELVPGPWHAILPDPFSSWNPHRLDGQFESLLRRCQVRG